MTGTVAGKILGAFQPCAAWEYSEATIRDVACKARVTEGAVFRLFGNKRLLWEQAIQCQMIGSFDPAKPPQKIDKRIRDCDVHAQALVLRKELGRFMRHCSRTRAWPNFKF